MDKYIGEQVGQYIILKRCAEKHSDGHALYDGKCIFCDYIRTSTRIKELKKANKECHHIEIKIKWKSQRLMRIFKGMKCRCYNSNNKDYRFYGKKGISICREWLNDPNIFQEWALDNGYQENLSIDRIDETKGYSPGNCRWITVNNNAKYKSTTNIIEVDGKLNSGAGWSVELGFGVNYINNYIKKHGIEETILFIKDKITSPVV